MGWIGPLHGYYYLTTTTWGYIQITRGTSMAELKTATPKVVWNDTTTDRCCHVWAPEIHWMPSTSSWYIYYTSGTSANYDGQRLHVLKGNSSDIWESIWSYAGKLAVPNRDDVWSIDATVLYLKSGPYMVYSSFDGDDQCLWIAKMTSPTSLGDAYKISTPTNSWERIGAAVNEGPAGLYHRGRTWIVYSASSCSGSGYSLASLELTGRDPLLASSWTKNNTGPIFSGANGNAATGHNGFFTAPSGHIYNVYHASPPEAVGCGSNRRTMVQATDWFANGAPNLGQPRPLTEEIPEPA